MDKHPDRVRVIADGSRHGYIDRKPTEASKSGQVVKLWRFHPDDGRPTVYLPAGRIEQEPTA